MKKKQLCLLVCGSGALAGAIMKYRGDRSVVAVKFRHEFDPRSLPASLRKRIVAVHAGSGVQLMGLVGVCEKFGIPMIQASTGIGELQRIRIPVVEVPNLALSILAFLRALPAFLAGLRVGGAADIAEITVTESHQKEKKTVPGTARKMALSCEIPENAVVSLRRRRDQLAFGVPVRNLGRHAYHRIRIRMSDGNVIELWTKVHGLDSYAAGAAFVADRILEMVERRELLPGSHSVATAPARLLGA